MDVETQIVVGKFGRLLLQLPGEGNLPAERMRAETGMCMLLCNVCAQGCKTSNCSLQSQFNADLMLQISTV